MKISLSRVLAAFVVVLGLSVAFIPKYIFPICESGNLGFFSPYQPVMRCFWFGKMEIFLGLLVVLAGLVGFNPETDFTITPWLKDDVSSLTTDVHNWMIVGDRILLHKGDVAEFYGTPFTVAGVLEPTGTGMDWTIYISQKSLRKMVSDSGAKAEMPLRIPEGDVSAVFIRAEQGVDLIDLAEKIEQTAPGSQAILSSTVAKVARRQLSGITGLLGCIVIGLWAMALALALSGVVFSMAVRERRLQACPDVLSACSLLFLSENCCPMFLAPQMSCRMLSP